MTTIFSPKTDKFSPDKFSPRQDKKRSVLSGWSLKWIGGPLVIKDRRMFKGPSPPFLSCINTELFLLRKIILLGTKTFCYSFLSSLISIICRYMFISDFLFISKCKRRTLNVDEESRCYMSPHTNVTSVAVLFFPLFSSCKYCKHFRLVCESRMELFV